MMNATTLVDYWFNLEHIKTVLCINKDRPELKCNGQCYLMQHLKANEQKEKEDKLLNIELTKTEYIDLTRIQLGQHSNTSYFFKEQQFYYHLASYPSQTQGIFHPPRS